MLALSDLLKQSPQSGARGLVHLATSADVSGLSGGYYVGTQKKRSSSASLDEQLQERVWAESERRAQRLSPP